MAFEGGSRRETLVTGYSVVSCVLCCVYQHQYTHPWDADGCPAAAGDIHTPLYCYTRSDGHPAADFYANTFRNAYSPYCIQYAYANPDPTGAGPRINRAGCGEYAGRSGGDVPGTRWRGEQQ